MDKIFEFHNNIWKEFYKQIHSTRVYQEERLSLSRRWRTEFYYEHRAEYFYKVKFIFDHTQKCTHIKTSSGVVKGSIHLPPFRFIEGKEIPNLEITILEDGLCLFGGNVQCLLPQDIKTLVDNYVNEMELINQ